MKPPFIRSPYNYDTAAASTEAAIPPDGHGESLTVQSMSEDADINVIMQRFGVTGKMPENFRLPEYGDYSDISDFRSAIDAVRSADASFMTLPASLRAQFQNNPQIFLDYCTNPGNMESLVKLGLAKVREDENVQRATGDGGGGSREGAASSVSGPAPSKGSAAPGGASGSGNVSGSGA